MRTGLWETQLRVVSVEAPTAPPEVQERLRAGFSTAPVVVPDRPAVMPPKWSLGYHQSRYGYASAIEIQTVASALRYLQIPTDAIHLDIDYMDRLQMFTWNNAMFPDPPAMNASWWDGF